jgi:predicted O-linked N-acetylglucosamine transferase (SPINDLY family)
VREGGREGGGGRERLLGLAQLDLIMWTRSGWCMHLVVLAYVWHVCSTVSDETANVRGNAHAQALLQEASRLNRPQDAAIKAQMLEQASAADPSNVAAARELALAAVQVVLGARIPDDTSHRLMRQAAAALERYWVMVRSNGGTQADLHVEPQQNVEYVCNVLVHFGHQLEGRDRPLMALEVYEAAHRLSPANERAVGSLFKVREWLCEWGRAEEDGGGYARRDEAFLALMALVRQQLESSASTSQASQEGRASAAATTEVDSDAAVQTALQPLTALSQEVDSSMQLRIARAWVRFYVGGNYRGGASLYGGNQFLSGESIAKPRDGRLTVAYLSGDLRGHAVSHLMKPIFGAHHRSARVRTVVLSTFAGNIGADGRLIQTLVHQVRATVPAPCA